MEADMKHGLSWVVMPGTPLILAIAWSASCRAASVVLTLDLEPQYASQLCWAAANTMALSSFFTSCQVGASPGRSSQATDAAYNILNVTSLSAPLPPPGLKELLATASGAADVAQVLGNCEVNIQACNHPGVPILLGLTYTTATSSTDPTWTGLTWTQAKAQIDGRHPFLFVWNYPSTKSKSKPAGSHQLIAIGYSDDSAKQKLIIWDPWPVPDTQDVISQVPGCGPLTLTAAQVGTGHRKKIDFSVYTDPQSDMGVAAEHDSDQYDLGLPKTPEPPSNPQVGGNMSPISPLDVRARANKLLGMVFTPVLFSSQPATAAPAMMAKPMLDKNAPAGEDRQLGIPFPIVGLGLEQLSAPGLKPTALLTQAISAVLFPVETGGTVSDSFLMLFRNGKWERGGYANTEVTRLLVNARLRYADEHHLNPKDFYMVSVPGLAAFFVAHGYGSEAVLISASNDPLIGAVAGSATPAAAQLGRLVDTINRQAAAPSKSATRPLRR